MDPAADTSLPLTVGRPIRRRLGRRLLGVAALAVAALGLARHVEVTRYKVTSGSMEPTLAVGHRFEAESSARPAIGDIVVFHPPVGARRVAPICGASDEGAGSLEACSAPLPEKSSATFVKRVVAGPGDLISIVGGHVVRNGVTEAEPYIAPCRPGDPCSFPAAVRVPAGEYYLLGDNRGDSDDSRFWGPVPRRWIIGVAVRCALLDTLCRPVR